MDSGKRRRNGGGGLDAVELEPLTPVGKRKSIKQRASGVKN